MAETRTEYLARVTAEFPGAYHRIDDLMRDWDRQHALEMSAQDAAESVAWDGGPQITLPEPNAENASPEGGEPEPAAPATQPEEPASASNDATKQE